MKLSQLRKALLMFMVIMLAINRRMSLSISAVDAQAQKTAGEGTGIYPDDKRSHYTGC